MGRSGSVMVREPAYGKFSVTDWVQHKVYGYLCRRGIEVCAPNDVCNTEDADHWEIQIGGSFKGKKFIPDCTKLEKAIADLKAHPGRIKDGKTQMGEQVACMLEEGVKAVKRHGYTCVQIDWF